MKAYGIPVHKAKSALKELLELYNGQWNLIEDENYKVLLDFILAKIEEDSKVVKSKKKKTLLHAEPQESEPLVKRLRSRQLKENASASTDEFKPKEGKTPSKKEQKTVAELVQLSQTTSDSEDCQPLLKRSCSRQRIEEASPSLDNCNLIMMQTSVGKVREYENELSCGSQSCSVSKDLEPPLVSLLPWHREEKASVSVKNSNIQMVESKLGKLGWDVVEISQSCLGEEIGESTQLYHRNVETNTKPLSHEGHVENKGNKVDSSQTHELLSYETKRSSKSAPCQEEGKTPVMPQVSSGEGGLTSEQGADISCLLKPKVEPEKEHIPSANELDLFHSDSLHRPRDESFVNEKLKDEVPLAVIHTASPSLLCADYSSNQNTSSTKENSLQIPESKSLNVKEKDNIVSNLSQFDIVSSADGEVKISLICNSSRQSGFHVPQVETVLELADRKFWGSYKIMEPSFSVKKVMKDLIECFMAMETDPVDGEHVRSETASPVFDTSKKSNAHDISGEVTQSLKSYITKAVEKHSLGRGFIEPLAYVDDISRGEERVKISLVNGSSSEEFPIFLYISKNVVFEKACVNFTLACIADEDCCSECSKDCLLSSIPCECARQTGSEFAYTQGGLLKDSFLDDFISSNQRFQKRNLFFCRDCPLERFKGKMEPKSCKGHLERRFIKECWSRCGCSKKCGNRVVQQGIAVALQVFQTLEGKGWGVRTIDDLPRGAFVCEYVGEIINNSEMHERNMQGTFGKKHTFPVPLDAQWFAEDIIKDEKALYLDSTFYGNVARFINHRCSDANLIGIPVEVETPDHHYYHLAFFTRRKIAAMEELTWDYGIEFGDQGQPVKPFKCLCRSSFCRDIDR
ncbi:hypothetical protein REPUB_Repub15cG0038000 [Reevesia pubescens]